MKYDGRLLAFGQMSAAQQKWWVGKGTKKYKQTCLDAADASWEGRVEYVIVWGAEIENRAALAFVFHPGTTTTGTVQMSNGDSGTVSVTTPGTTEAVPTVRPVSLVHLYVFSWREGKLDGPIWMTDRAGEGWSERGWNQTHPASQQLLDDALKFLARPDKK